LAFDSENDRRTKNAGAPARSSNVGWLVGLAIGFAAGVPVGGFLFPQTTVVSVPAAKEDPQAAQLAAAEARARAAEQAAAAVRPLPAPRQAQEAQPLAAAQPGAAEPEAAEAPPAAADPVAEKPAAPPPAAAAGAKTPAPAALAQAPAAARSREAARAATEALNTGSATAKAADVPAAPAPAPQPSAAPVAAAPAAPAGPEARSVDSLLDQALSSTAAKQEQERQAAADRALAAANTIPVAPSREDVTKAMTVLLPAIRGCAAGQSGLANVGIVVKNDGHVESASVTGAPFEGDRSGRCMEGVVRRAKFPRFQQSSFRIVFPFAIQ
jgi:hypothetical protein